MTRANARELAVHLVYGWEFTGEEPRGEYCIVINAAGSKVEFDTKE